MKALSLQEAADRLNVSKRRAWERFKRGDFPNAFQVGKGNQIIIPTADVDALLKRLGKDQKGAA